MISLNGYGPLNAKKAAKKIIKNQVSCLISFGFAASCDDSIKSGAIVIPKNIIWRNSSKNQTSITLRKKIIKKLSSNNFSSKNMYSSKNIIFSIDKKNEISTKFNVSCIDMESEDIQKIAKKNRLPFVAVRIVIDDLKLEIPQFITKATKANGETNYLLILLGIIKKPTSLINIFRLGLHYYSGLRKLKVLGKLIFNNF